jgi:Bacterial Ig-like domain
MDRDRIEPGPPVGIVGGSLAPGQHAVYISLVPGSMPTAQRVNITSPRSPNFALYPAVVDGGFDPVGIAAEVGDTLIFGVERTNGGPAVYTYVVRPGTAPTVVRVSPRTHAPNVRLDESIFVVLSEPLDIRALAPGAIGLLDAGVPVGATAKFREPSATAVELVPEAPLRASTAYEVDVTSAVVGRTGVPLERPIRTDFTTRVDPSPAVLAITSFTMLEFKYPRDDRWYYAPQIVVAESGAKGGAEIRRLDFSIPGLGNIPPMCSTGIWIPPGGSESLVGEAYGDWEFTIFGSKRAEPGEAAVMVTYLDMTGRRVTLTARGPVVAGSLPTTYTGGRGSMSPGFC